MPFLNRLEHWAQTAPDRPAVVIGEASLSYAELAGAVRAQHRPGSALTILQQRNSVDFVVRFAAAVAGSGRVAVLDPDWPAEISDAVRSRLAELPVPPAPEPSGPLPGGAAPAGLQDGPGASEFLIGLTSGTSGTPKGFSRNRASWQLSFEASVEFFGLSEAEPVLVPGPLSSSLNLYALAECLYAGATFYGLPEFDLAEALRLVERQQIQRLVLVPTMLAMLARRAAEPERAGTVRTVLCAGSSLEPAIADAARRWLPDAVIFEYLGASELGFIAAGRLESPAGREDTAVGPAFPGVEISIRDRAGAELPAWLPGSIFVRSRLISDGYLWGQDGEGFQQDGQWSTVGDQGFLSGNGVLHFLGRRSDMINSAGHNVYPHEIEHALSGLPGVQSAVAVGIPDGVRGQRIVAGVVPADRFSSSALTGRVLRQGIAGVLAEYKIPGLFFELRELPLGSSGKLNRAQFAEWIARGDQRVRRIG